MAKVEHLVFLKLYLILISVVNLSSAIYEDQVGKFDWKRSFIGKSKFAEIDSKRIVIATEQNVLASLNLKNGQILWRHILEDPKEYEIKLLYIDRDIYTVSGTINTWIVRSWEINTGALITEWPIITDKLPPMDFRVIDGKLINIIPVLGSHLEVSSYYLSTGEVIEKNLKISAPWVKDTSNCVVSSSKYVCLSSNDYSGQLYFIDFLTKDDAVHSKSIQSILGDGLGPISIKQLNTNIPAFLLISNRLEKLVEIEKENIKIKEIDISGETYIARNEDKLVLYQFEASSTPDKLISLVSKEYSSGQELSRVDVDYPIGVGVPVIIASSLKGSNGILVISTSDNALLTIKIPEGKVQWTIEEALSDIVATEFFELPMSELDASIENEFKTNSNNLINMLIHRLSTQAKQLSNLIFGSQLLSANGLVRDEFGFHKLIVVATKVGKLFAIDTLSGSIAWSYRLPNVRPFKLLEKDKMFLFVQRTARYAPLPALCTLLAEDSTSGNAVLFQFDPITGYSTKGIEKLEYKLAQAMLLPYEDENNLKPVLLLSSEHQASVHPPTAKLFVYNYIKQNHIFLVDSKKNSLKGYNFYHSTKEEFKLTPTWEIKFSPGKIVSVNTKHPNERVHSQGRVLPDRSVYYKYVNPNLISVATVSEDPVHKHVLSIYLIDGISGLIMYSTSHKRAKTPIKMVHSENWLVYSYFSERFRRTEVVSAELYEGHVQSNSTVFSSHAISVLPHVQTQSYILPATPVDLTVTLTEKGITNKFLLLGLSTGVVIEIPWLLLQPRFNDIPCGPEESCIPYMPEVPLPAEAIINYNQSLSGIKGIEVAAARLESTCHVLIHGLDMFYTRVAPSKTFDVLKEDFDYIMIVLVLTGLVLASYITKYLASKKTLKQMWK
ncbi:unnamed protein product [Diabrotica balteata]|uniref:ER membrane protein complex subunit 1 n=1 Tax=Diabrotica balteata TaxID=107213 RepID=A0A9N9SRW4_DIABA|nr:unnamed protein product [Diabrotica balteata]